jgi:hypothetical protein
MAFVDYENVFGRLERNIMWGIMFESGFTEHIMRVVQNTG